MTKKIDEQLTVENNKIHSRALFSGRAKVKPSVLRAKPALNVQNISIRNLKRTQRVLPGQTDQKFAFGLKPTTGDVAITTPEKQVEYGLLYRATRFVRNHYRNQPWLYQMLFIMFNIFVIFGILLYQQNTMGVMSFKEFLNIENKSFEFLGYAFAIFLVIMLFETLRTYVLLLKSTQKHLKVLSYKTAALSRYYDCFIPGIGGKPFELFYLNTNGIKPSIATAVPIAKYMFYSLANVITSTVVLIFSWNVLNESKLVLFLGILMLLVNLLLVIGMVTLSVSKKLAPKIVLSVLLFLERIRIIKNHKSHFLKFMRFMLEYQKSVEYYLRSKGVTILSVFFSLAISLLKASLPFFVYAIFAAPADWSLLLDFMSKYYIMVMTINFIPIPGGSGVTEIAFTALFMPYFKGGTLFWSLIIYRAVSYLIYLLQGIIVLVYEYLKNNLSIRKQSAKQLESGIEND